MSMSDLHKGTTPFGFVYIEPASASYDQELFLALRDWEPFFTYRWSTWTPTPRTPTPPARAPAVVLNAHPRPTAWKSSSTCTCSINDKATSAPAGHPASQGQRVLFHFPSNASAIENRRIALGGHLGFQVIALDIARPTRADHTSSSEPASESVPSSR